MVLNRMPLNLCIKKLGHRSRLGETTINFFEQLSFKEKLSSSERTGALAQANHAKNCEQKRCAMHLN